MNPWQVLGNWLRRGGDPDRLELPPGARMELDLPYGAEPAQTLDLYVPGEVATGPLLIVVTGGAWSMGDKAAPRTVRAKVGHWLPAGWTVASLGYRRLPLTDPIEQARDVARAIAFLQQHAATAGVDATDVVLIGHSSGAHLVALLAADAELTDSEGVRPWLATVLVDTAALDVVELMRSPHLPLHDRAFGTSEEYWRRASPLHRLSRKPSPMLLVHSTRRPEAAEQAQAFAAAAAAHGARAEVLPIDLSHAELNALLGEDPEYTAQVDAFLRSAGAPRNLPSPRPSGSDPSTT